MDYLSVTGSNDKSGLLDDIACIIYRHHFHFIYHHGYSTITADYFL